MLGFSSSIKDNASSYKIFVSFFLLLLLSSISVKCFNASFFSVDSNNSTASLADFIRPQALILGAILNWISATLGCSKSKKSISALNPKLSELAIFLSPILTIALFSSINGIKSATVPKATISIYSKLSSPISA